MQTTRHLKTTTLIVALIGGLAVEIKDVGDLKKLPGAKTYTGEGPGHTEVKCITGIHDDEGHFIFASDKKPSELHVVDATEFNVMAIALGEQAKRKGFKST